MVQENRIKRLIQEGGFTIEEFINNVSTISYIDEHKLRSYIDTGNLPDLTTNDFVYTHGMALKLGLKFQDMFRN